MLLSKVGHALKQRSMTQMLSTGITDILCNAHLRIGGNMCGFFELVRSAGSDWVRWSTHAMPQPVSVTGFGDERPIIIHASADSRVETFTN